MTRRFPRGVNVTFRKTSASGRAGYDYEARTTDGALVATGWSAGSRADAREEAWLALEQCGLVVDE
jgi:hypothetical protein